MQAFPHHYSAAATAEPTGSVEVKCPGVPALQTAPPAEFGGPGDQWSPEALLVSAISDCFILSFRAISRVGQLPWTDLVCETVGTLDRVERVTSFTHFVVDAKLKLPAGSDVEKAEKLLKKAKQSCLITQSLKAPCELKLTISCE